ncbi:16018_t:CDS:2, partial [Gigaspora rosea]
GGPVFSYSPIKLPYVSVVGISIGGDESSDYYLPLSVILRITKLSYNLTIMKFVDTLAENAVVRKARK